MFALEQWFAHLQSPPEHIVMCSFEANLPFAEHRLLDRLHREGARHITVLVGARDYSQGLAELAATRHAGIYYAIHRIRLSGRRAAFHAKLYLVAWRDSARLLVTSANLTPTGFRSNLEVVDELRLSVGEASDVAAFRSYAEFLTALPAIDTRLSPRVGDRLEAAAAVVSDLADHCRERDEPVMLLHSASRSLSEQLRPLVEGSSIRRITVVAPFFDDGSSGVRGFVRALVGSERLPELRVLIDAEATLEVDGHSLLPLAQTVMVERVRTHLQEPEMVRRLHAKVFLVEAKEQAWLVSGSANATAAAWLRSSVNGGNLEAVTVRRLRTADAPSLFDQLQTAAVAVDELRRERDDDDEEDDTTGPILLDATVVGDHLQLRCSDRAWWVSGCLMHARLTSREGSALLSLGVMEESAAGVSLRSLSSHDILHSGVAVAVSLEAQNGNGVAHSSPVWLDKPLYQELDPLLRAGVRAIAQLAEQASVNGADPLFEAAQFLTSLTVRLAADLGGPSREASGHTGGGTGGAEAPPDGEATDEDWDEGDSQFGSTSSGADLPPLPGGATVRRMAGPRVDAHVQMAQRLFDGVLNVSLRDVEDNEDTENAAARRRAERLGRARSAESGRSIDGGSSGDASTRSQLSPSGKQLLRRGLESLDRSVDRVLRLRWTVETVPVCAGTLDALLGALVRYQQHLEKWGEALQNVCGFLLEDVWARIWSIDGYLLGSPNGFYIRSFEDPAIGAAIQQFYSDPQRFSRVAAMAALTAVLRKDAYEPVAHVPRGILAGMALVSGGRPLVEGEFGSRIAADCASLATNLDLPDAATLLNSLDATTARGSQDNELLRTWMPLIRLESTRRRGGTATTAELVAAEAEVPRALLNRYKRVIQAKRQLGSILSTKAGIMCGECESILPAEWQNQIQKASFVPVCESCGALLAPIAWDSDAAGGLLKRIQTLMEKFSS